MNEDTAARLAAHRPRAIVESTQESPRAALLIVGLAFSVWLLLALLVTAFIVGPR